MEQNKNHKKHPRRYLWLIFTLGFLILSALFEVLARRFPNFAPFYSNTFYQFFQGAVSRFSNLFPFSLSEILLYTLPTAFIIILIVKIIKRKSVVKLFKILAVIASALLLIYQLNCGINYYNISFAEKEGFTRIENDKELLIKFCETICDKLRENSSRLLLNDSEKSSNSAIGSSTSDVTTAKTNVVIYPKGTELATESINTMENLGGIYSSLEGYYPRPKPLINPRPFSNMGVTGIYSPFTIEANYNTEMTGYNLPFTACHELSHLRGYMNESEANFIAFLACINSDDLSFQRSGYLMAWIYAGNQLYDVDRNEFNALYSSLPEDVKKELAENNQFWDKHETKASNVQDSVNDQYLKNHGIAEGIQSYSNVVGLMLGWFSNI